MTKKPAKKSSKPAKPTSTNQAWWAELDACGKAWRTELGAQAKIETDPTDKQLDKLLASTSLDFYVSGGGRLDLSPLRRFPRLKTVRFAGFRELSNLEVLAELPDLRELALSSNNLTDISALAPLVKLVDLDVMQNKLTDISPLAGMTNLVALDVGYNKLADLSPLRGMTKLKKLSIRVNKVVDLKPLAELVALTELLANDNKFSDLAPLAKLSSVERLDVGGPFAAGKVTSLAPLGSLKKLKQLDISNHQKIDDVSPLKTCSALRDLTCQVIANNAKGFVDLLAIKSLASISTHREILTKADRDALKKARPKLELELG